MKRVALVLVVVAVAVTGVVYGQSEKLDYATIGRIRRVGDCRT